MNTNDNTFIPAVLVTGSDANGNEFGYRKSGDEWVDYYNECVTTAERIRREVFPNVQYVRYPINGAIGYKMSRAEWIENGCPLDLPKSMVEQMINDASGGSKLRWGNVIFDLEAMGENARQRSAILKQRIEQRRTEAQTRFEQDEKRTLGGRQ